MSIKNDIQKIPRISEKISFPAEEEKILKYWKEIKAFELSLEQSKGKPKYTFYDGPPFATGLPHYGHILTGTIKDIVTRYAYQQGYQVERRFGWDTHGLPVEYEVDKKLGIKGPEDVMKMGIEKYNLECRKIVMSYSKEWEEVVERLGRWIDFKNDYKTLYPWFMESVWWVFKELYLKGLVYRGNKVVPYSTGCSTPLSNFESGQNYKDVVDPAITVNLLLLNYVDNAALLIWTTTPWTLPGNLAVCVNPTLEYVTLKQISTGKLYIMLEATIERVFKGNDYVILKKFLGKELEGLQYEPVFPYFKQLSTRGAFRVLVDEYVTSDIGTGIVHQAPYFGEDDYRVCLKAGVISKDVDPICPLDSVGRFVDPVTDFKGQYVKDADRNIINYLRDKKLLVHQSQIKHSYPFCWRSDTPLIYKAVPSWFLKVEHMQQQLLTSTHATHWVPDYIKEKRFGNWLKEAHDWAISRNRFWGNPIPIWESENDDEKICVGSIAELERLTGKNVTDLHRENIDMLEIPSVKSGNPPLRRVSEVFDCWFESGCLPYAQHHYPFKNPKEFEKNFPADFIAEGIDQTRGWFYTLTVISTALFNKAPYKNVIVNGLVLAEDGWKMSKRKKNYPDPIEIVNEFGADALRLYLISSSVVRAENVKFKKEGIRGITKDILLPWYNAFRFLMQSSEVYIDKYQEPVMYGPKYLTSTNTMDCWILSSTHSLLNYMKGEMKLYHLYSIIPKIIKFIDNLTNWYIRMNRKRFKGDEGQNDCKTALTALYNVLENLTRMMAPFTPFMAENIYQHLKIFTPSREKSVHFLSFPSPQPILIDSNKERIVSRMQTVIELGRVIRDKRSLPIKYPLKELIVVHQNIQYTNDILSLQHYILTELNVRKISVTTDRSQFGIALKAEPDYKVIGQRFKEDLKALAQKIKTLTDDDIHDMIIKGYKKISDHHVELTDVRLTFNPQGLNIDRYEINSNNEVLILMDITLDSFMREEKIAREIITYIQKLRKKAHLVPTDKIKVFYNAEGNLADICEKYNDFIEHAVQTSVKSMDQMLPLDKLIIEENEHMEDGKLYIALTKTDAEQISQELPFVKWVNMQLVGLKSKYCYGATKGVILLEANNKILNLEQFRAETSRLFGVSNFILVLGDDSVVESEKILLEASGKTVFVIPNNKKVVLPRAPEVPFCKFINFEEYGSLGTALLENPLGNPTARSNKFELID